MADVFTQAKRSDVMSRIRSRGNRDTELALAKFFRQHGITGWRRNQLVFGKPDFVFQKLKLAVFVDGCFWHACPLHATNPRNNATFWQKKLSANKARDRKVNRLLPPKAGGCCAYGSMSLPGATPHGCSPAFFARWREKKERRVG